VSASEIDFYIFKPTYFEPAVTSWPFDVGLRLLVEEFFLLKAFSSFRGSGVRPGLRINPPKLLDQFVKNTFSDTYVTI
jgi:hypothetical protein